MKSLDQHFKVLKSQTEKTLPLEGHQMRFQQKLTKRNRPSIKLMTWTSIAASIVLLFGLSSIALPTALKASATLTATYQAQVMAQLQYLEMKYQATHATPLQDIKLQLHQLDLTYTQLENTFNTANQHPLLLKAMIDNLQQRLNILNELEQALKAQNKNDYENIIL